jgi:membrane associated rhomboid family serine protease
MRNNGYGGTPPVTLNLIIINVLFFMATALLPGGRGDMILHKLSIYFWESPYFSPYQFVTHMFLHANFMHLFANMFALWMFGRVLEYSLGAKKFLIYYFVCGIGAAVMQLLVNWWEISALYNAGQTGLAMMQTNIPMLGASGAVFGILLAFGMMYPNSVIMLLIPPIPMKAKYFVIIYGVFELLLGVYDAGDGVAHFAHIGGMLWGFLLLLYWKKRGKIRY